MANIGNLPGERLAGLASDLFHKLQKGVISLDELALFTQRKNPFVWERNENGHVVLSIVGLGMTGEAEVKGLRRQKYNVNSWAESCFKSTNQDSFDSAHRLVSGQTYRVVLVPGSEIENSSERTTQNLLALGERYGYLRPQAGIIPRLRERLTDKQLEELGWWCIVALHQLIVDADCGPSVLGLCRSEDGRGVDALWNGTGLQWSDETAFAFLVPADPSDLIV